MGRFIAFLMILLMTPLPAPAQLQQKLPETETEDKGLQDLTPAEMLRLFLPQVPQEQETAPQKREAFDRERTQRTFDRQRYRLRDPAVRGTYQAIADLVMVILTVKKIGLSREDTEAIAREMARISMQAHGAAPPPAAKEETVETDDILAAKGVVLTLPDGQTKLTFIDRLDSSDTLAIRLGGRVYRLTPGEGIDTPGGCLLFLDDVNRPGTVAEFTYRCSRS